MPEALPVFASMIVSTCVLFKQRKKAALSVSRPSPDPRVAGPGAGGAGSRDPAAPPRTGRAASRGRPELRSAE